jgi:2-polyprenyl-3-methyl-5-hydroxy-6-metoxy-1,4-benzoquinol methylase
VRRRVFLSHVQALRLDWSRLTVLDVGAGTGFYVDIWRSLGVKSITAADLAAVAVERLQKTHPDVATVQLDIGGSLTAQGFERTFDVITAFDVLFHIVDDARFRAAIFNISSLCRSGGYFIFSDNFLHGQTKRTPHQVHRSLEEIAAVLEAAGFRIVKRAPMFFLMNALVDTRRAWPLLLWRAFMLPLRAVNVLGAVYGAVLFPLELTLTRLCKESPTTEIMICRKH